MQLVCLVIVCCCAGWHETTCQGDELLASADYRWIEDRDGAGDVVWITDEMARHAQFQQPLSPRVEAQSSTPLSPTSQNAARQFWMPFGVSQVANDGSSGVIPASANSISGQEATIRASTDLGDLMGGSGVLLDLGIQRRNPIVNDPRVRGSEVGTLAASGSYWVPARIDLDTMASKIDSRLVEQVTVIPGPYSALYGPGKQFVDFQLKPTPRYGGAFQVHGTSSVDYRTNGEQWYGRQSFEGGDDVWGFRVGYGHRTGNDYKSGDDDLIPSSYKSRDIDLALGAQITPDSVLEGQALRLDQTDVEMAGQAFDIDWLVTDGYDVEYIITQPAWADLAVLDIWYNATALEGSAQRPSKREQFPFYAFINFVGFTDVHSLSTGFRAMSRWEGRGNEVVEAGTDLRYLKQELNEFTSGQIGFAVWADANSPIPKSDYVNPGLFIQTSLPMTDAITTLAGARVDYVGAAVLAGPGELDDIGISSQLGPPLSAFDYWGANDANHGDMLGMAYLGAEYAMEGGWGASAKVGFSERAPNLTERYAVETFMALIQNGLNSVTGDPDLDKEQLLQIDLDLTHRADRWRTSVGAFHGWVHNYVTFEAMSRIDGPPNGQVEQVNLKYVNTDLATLWGCQARVEYEWNDLLTPFASVMYVQGDDRTRNGDFATRQAQNGNPSVQVAGRSRGFFSGLPGNDKEPLPGIIPLESRLGLRWEEHLSTPNWGVELSTRVVDNQDRVAVSLLESTTPGFTTLDLRTFVRSKGKMFTLGIENLTNKQYREHLDFRSRNPLALSTFRPGITVYLGTELTY